MVNIQILSEFLQAKHNNHFTYSLFYPHPHPLRRPHLLPLHHLHGPFLLQLEEQGIDPQGIGPGGFLEFPDGDALAGPAGEI